MTKLAFVGCNEDTVAWFEQYFANVHEIYRCDSITALDDIVDIPNQIYCLIVDSSTQTGLLEDLKEHTELNLLPVLFVLVDETSFSGSVDVGFSILDYISMSAPPSLVEYRIDRLFKEQQRHAKTRVLETQIIQSEKMAALGQLAAGVAHEINNPIGFVSSNIHLVKKYVERIKGEVLDLEKSFEQEESGLALLHYTSWQAESKLPRFLDDLIDVTEESDEGLGRIKEIVKDLKEYAHVGSQSFESININDILHSCVNLLRNEIKYKADVVFELDDIPRVDCISSQINQVFVNVIINACQAIEEFGQISIRTEQDGGFVEVSISDTGTGIELEKVAKIFEPFYTTKPIGKGTGIGLAITKSIIDRHEGEIKVHSILGEGTTFIIRLPITPSE